MPRTILIAVKDLLFGSKVHEAAKRTGTTVLWSSRFEKLSDQARAKSPDTLIVDLMEPDVLDELAAVKAHAPATRIIGFLGHERVDLMEAAEALGVEEILTRGQFAKAVDSVLIRERGEG